MRALILALGLAMAAAPAAAAETAPARDDDGDKVVCKKEAKPNSRFVTRTCLTKAEWEQRAETARKALFEVQNRTMTYSGKGN